MPVVAMAGAAALAVAATSLSPAVVRTPSRSADSRDPIVRVRTTAPVIALSVDDGPNPGSTAQVLSLLRRHRAHATFFLVGHRAQRHPRLVRAQVRDGHEVASHTWSHKDLTRLSPRAGQIEIEAGIAAVTQVTGVPPALFRAPYGATTRAIGGRVEGAGARVIGWTANLNVEAALRRRTVSAAARLLRRRARRGGIVIAHDGPADRPRTVAVLRRLLPALRADGYRIVTVSQLLAHAGR